MGLDLIYLAGQTPIDENEKEGLLIKTISNRSELNEFEQINIEKATIWSLGRKFNIDRILTEAFIKELHKKMFEDVWNWAGQFRTSNKNIGVDKFDIKTELKILFDDCKYWIQNKIFSEDEISIRFSHRIVKIHPFPNGNGRHSRLIADILVSHVFKKKTLFLGWNKL
jgi:Fic-DOC domain mobile mystery protein B